MIPLLAATLTLGDAAIATRAVLIGACLLVTMPVASHVIVLAADRRGERMQGPGAIDERHGAAGERAVEGPGLTGCAKLGRDRLGRGAPSRDLVGSRRRSGAVCCQKRQVKSGQIVVLRPFASMYQLAQPPEFHTVRGIRAWSRAL